MNINTEVTPINNNSNYYDNDSEIHGNELLNKEKEWLSRALDEIKLSAQRSGWEISGHIKNHVINSPTPIGQQALIEIAKLAAQQNGTGTSLHIHKYGIDTSTTEGQRAMIEIAKIAVQNHCQDISRFIQNYKIDTSSPEGLQGLIDIAKFSVQRNSWEISEYIKNYGFDTSTLEGQQALIEIARLDAQQYGRGISTYINNYDFDKFPGGQQILISVAKLAAKQDGKGTSEQIQQYGIDTSTSEGQQALIAIAKIAVQDNGKGASRYIKNYGIDKFPGGPQALVEIAKLAAQHDGKYTSKYIENYGIDKSSREGGQVLITIAKLAAQQDGIKTSKYIENYGMDGWTPTEKAYMSNFLFNCIAKQLPTFSRETLPGHLAERTNNFYFADFDLFELSFITLDRGDLNGALQEGLKVCKEKLNMDDRDLEWVQKSLPKSEDSYIQKRFLEWFLVTAALCLRTPHLREIFKKEQDIFEKIAKLNPYFREALVKEIIHLAYVENVEGFKRMKEHAKNTSHVKLPCLILANFPREGEAIYRTVILRLQMNRDFKEGKNQKILLQTLIKIRQSSLDSLQKVAVIKELCGLPSEHLLQGLQIVSDLLAFKGEHDITPFSDLEGLQSSLSALFIQKFNVKIENFYNKYQKTIGEWRNKDVVMTYASKLNELPYDQKDMALKLFQELLTMILNKSFHQDRYNVDKNPHLAEIKDFHVNVFVQWQKMELLSAAEILVNIATDKVPIVEQIIKALKRALEQHHLGGGKQDELYPYVSFCTGQWDNLDESIQNLDMELKPLSGRKLNGDVFEKNKNLLLQKQLLGVIRNPADLEKKLIELKSLVPKDAEFYDDIVSSIKMLKTSDFETTISYQVIDTDDPNHFMLMGTEVYNSCQNVQGNPKLNVCLLGYFLDGKHRLGLVCDSQGKILARSVFRLLIDSQGYPVLFQERVYVAGSKPEYSQLLRKLALKKAANLGIPLVVSSLDFENDQGKPYPHPVHAKQKPVPFEYVDALNGIQDREYVIQNPLQVYAPKN